MQNCYLSSFSLPGEEAESGFILSSHSKAAMPCYGTNIYPFRVFPNKGMPEVLRFAPITIFYGGNGSGKSTLLNLIAEKLGVRRLSPFADTPFFEDYLALCRAELTDVLPETSEIITSDAVFDFLLDIRAYNAGTDRTREALFDEYSRARDPDAHMQLESLDDYDEYKRFREAKRMTKSAYTRKHLRGNLPGRSNGESAYAFFTHHIRENALYLLDEPENSLSAELQKELAQFLQDSVRFYGCQLILSTHSPFLLAMHGAKIYNLDAVPVCESRFADLPSVRLYYEFFEEHREDFRDV